MMGSIFTNKKVFILLFFNLLAFAQFSVLQVRYLLEISSSGHSIWSFLSILGAHNIWALLGILFLSLKKKSIVHWLIFFFVTASISNLFTAYMYQLYAGLFSIGRLVRSFILNSTGFVNTSILLATSLYAINEWFEWKKKGTFVRSEKLALKGTKGFQYLDPNEILFAKAEENYVTIQLRDKKDLFRSKIGDIEMKLTKEKGFVRLHRSYIANVNFVTQLSVAKNGMDMICHLGSKFTLPVSRLRKAEVKKILENNSM